MIKSKNYVNGQTFGRPKKEFNPEELILLFDRFGNWYDVADYLGVSKATLYKRLKDYNIVKSMNAVIRG